MTFKYHGSVVSEDFVMHIIESNRETVNCHFRTCVSDNSIVLIPSLGIEFCVDELQTHNKMKLLDMCNSSLSFFTEYDYVLWKYIVYSGMFHDFSDIAMAVTNDVMFLLLKWFATTPIFSSNIYSIEILAYKFRDRLVMCGHEEYITYFWKSFFEHYHKDLSECFMSHTNISSIMSHDHYAASPYERCMMVFGEDTNVIKVVKDIIYSGIKQYNILPNKVLMVFLPVNKPLEGIEDDVLVDMIVEAGALSLTCDKIDERIGVGIHSEYELKRSCQYIINNIDDSRIRKTLNTYKVKNVQPPLNCITGTLS